MRIRGKLAREFVVAIGACSVAGVLGAGDFERSHHRALQGRAGLQEQGNPSQS